MKKAYDPATEKPYFIDQEGARNYDYVNTLRYLQHKGRLKFGKHFRIHKEDLTIISKLLVYFTKGENFSTSSRSQTTHPTNENETFSFSPACLPWQKGRSRGVTTSQNKIINN
jgi:hypothetical protein